MLNKKETQEAFVSCLPHYTDVQAAIYDGVKDAFTEHLNKPSIGEEAFIKHRVACALDEYVVEKTQDAYDDLLTVLQALNDYYIGNRK